MHRNAILVTSCVLFALITTHALLCTIFHVSQDLHSSEEWFIKHRNGTSAWFSLSTSSTEIVHRPPHLNLYGEGLVRSLVFRTVNKQKKKTWDRPEFSISISKAQFSDKNLGICTISNIHYHFVLYLIISSKKITKFGLGSVVFFLFLFFSSFYFYQKKKKRL